MQQRRSSATAPLCALPPIPLIDVDVTSSGTPQSSQSRGKKQACDNRYRELVRAVLSKNIVMTSLVNEVLPDGCVESDHRIQLAIFDAPRIRTPSRHRQTRKESTHAPVQTSSDPSARQKNNAMQSFFAKFSDRRAVCNPLIGTWAYRLCAQPAFSQLLFATTQKRQNARFAAEAKCLCS
jgi:hypothetical protein